MASEEEAFVSPGALPPEPVPAAPLCVELLLLDEDASTMHEERRSSAKGLVANLQRQIEDSTSHLCRKSAFGSLISRGASVRVIGYEQVPYPHQARRSEPSWWDTEPTVTWSRPGVVPSRGSRGEPVVRAVLPRLPVPRPSSGPITLPTDGLGLLTALLSWVPSCGMESICRSTSSETARGCDVMLAEAQAASAQASDGWPMVVPEASVAFVSDAGKHAFAGSGSPGGVLAETQKLQARTWEFQKAAVELDDDELVILFPALLKSAPASSGSRTPSTAATTAEASLWPGPGRLVCKRQGVTRVRAVPGGQVEQLTAPWPHVVEMVCLPTAVDGPLHLLIAFPCAKAAQRFREAASEAVKLPRAAEESRQRGAVRCELRINARVMLDSLLARQNCAAVVSRGICEACHVSAERVLIQRLWSEPTPPNFDHD